MSKFYWDLAGITLAKTWLSTFFTTMGAVMITLDIEFLMTAVVALLTSGISTGTMFAQILARYQKIKEDEYGRQSLA